MTLDVWMMVVAGVLMLLSVWVGWTLTRLRRLASRVERARASFDAQLRRRAGLAEELARNHPAVLGADTAGRLAAAAAGTRVSSADDRELAENALGRELRELPADLPGIPNALRSDLSGTMTRVALARRFYNDAVRDTRELRGRRFPRWLGLHHSRPLPRYFDIDDRIEVRTRARTGTGTRTTDPAGRPGR